MSSTHLISFICLISYFKLEAVKVYLFLYFKQSIYPNYTVSKHHIIVLKLQLIDVLKQKELKSSIHCSKSNSKPSQVFNCSVK